MAKYASLDSLRAIRDWVKEKFQSKLPEVTAQDNGDVLSVVDGEWAKATPAQELPSVGSADNGKVLEVVEGAWAKATPEDELPEVSASDNGKFLGVVNGAWGKADVNALPAVTSQDNGKVLGVVEGQWAKTEPEDGLPEVTSSDNGKVLSVVEGAWAPAVPSGGSGLPEVTSEDNGDILSVVDGAWAKSEPEGPGYEVVETVIAPEQSVTTIEDGGLVWGDMTATWHSEYPESIIVTFNGTEYTLPKNTFAWGFGYGEYDGNKMPVFTTYPCSIDVGQSAALNTAEPGTYTVSARSEVLVPSDTFKEAVNLSYTQPTVTQETFWAAQSITTEAVSGTSYAAADGPAFDYDSPVPEKLNVVFDGTAYELPNIPMQIAYGEVTYEGSPDFTTYPLFLRVVDYGSYANLQLCTPQAGTYTLEATYDVSTTAPTEKFKEAVKACSAPGYDVSTEEVQIAAEQSVTTAAQGPHNYGQITATVPDPLPDSVNVTFNGTSYENVPKHAEASLGGIDIYGDIAFSEYPFVFTFAEGNLLLTQAAGTYTIAITRQATSVAPDDNFKAAVAESGIGAPLVVKFTLDNNGPIAPGLVEQTVVASHTYDEILAEYNKGRPILFDCFIATGVPSIGSYHCYGSPVLRSDNKLWLESMFPYYNTSELQIFYVEATIRSGDDLGFYWSRYTLTDAT